MPRKDRLLGGRALIILVWTQLGMSISLHTIYTANPWLYLVVLPSCQCVPWKQQVEALVVGWVPASNKNGVLN